VYARPQQKVPKPCSRPKKKEFKEYRFEGQKNCYPVRIDHAPQVGPEQNCSQEIFPHSLQYLALIIIKYPETGTNAREKFVEGLLESSKRPPDTYQILVKTSPGNVRIT